MNESDRPARRDTEPHVGSERQRPRLRVVREVDLERAVDLELAGREQQRLCDEIGRLGAHRRGEQGHEYNRAKHAATVALLALAGFTGCQHDTSAIDGAFYNWDGRRVHCAIDLDTYARNDLASVEAGLDRAVETGEVLELYAHDPGRTVEWSAIEAVLAATTARNLPFYTYADFAHGVEPGPGVALSFDDAYIDDWASGTDLYTQYGARLTFFIAYYQQLRPEQKTTIHELERQGHAIEAHSVAHLRAPLYAEQKGLGAYIADEALPSITRLRDDGYEVTTYAYPYGARTGELDDAILEHVSLIRSVSFTWSGVADPCPR